MDDRCSFCHFDFAKPAEANLFAFSLLLFSVAILVLSTGLVVLKDATIFFCTAPLAQLSIGTLAGSDN